MLVPQLRAERGDRPPDGRGILGVQRAAQQRGQRDGQLGWRACQRPLWSVTAPADIGVRCGLSPNSTSGTSALPAASLGVDPGDPARGASVSSVAPSSATWR